MSANNSPDPIAAAAAAAAARAFNIQLFTLYSIGVLVTVLRTYARIKAVGIRNLHGDDILIWIAILFYTSQTVLGYSVGSVAHGLANNGMTDAERAALSPDDPEYQTRVIGSKIQIAGWSIYSSLMCFLKLSVLVFYIRLTEGLGRRYRLQIWAGFGLVIGSFIASIAAILFSCLPIYRNWQIYPNPGNHCQPAISSTIVWTCFAANVITDLYLILIPLPMLWGTSLKLIKKIASSVVLGAGIFVLVSATLKTVFVIVDPVNGAQLAGEWGTREAFVAVFTTNLPMIFPLIKNWISPIFGSSLWSTQKSSSREGAQTIGGGSWSSKRNRAHSVNVLTTNLSATGSQEHMVQEIPLQNLKISGEPCRRPPASNAVYVTNQIDVVHEDVGSQNDDQKRQRIHESW
ncbi:hypothetical protein EV127DRAFT_500042 [Xylaria flabelliformis]|nr:hypothetical protein EV127DRAFT_500042 [Xylaria flabelliformis]